jgi:hypothetical protein
VNAIQPRSQQLLPGGIVQPHFVDVQGSNYGIEIKMDQQTVSLLGTGNYKLYLFKAVASAQGGGKPTVWASTTGYSTLTSIGWTENYFGYASTKEVQSGVNFGGIDTKQVDLGQTIDVGPNAVTTLDPKRGIPGSISIENTTVQPYTCGLAQPSPQGGKPSPICAFPLYGKNIDVITPIQKVALMFATQPLMAGTVIEQSFGPALLVNLTNSNNVSIGYNINGGWSWNGDAASELSRTGFVPALINNTASFAAAQTDPITSVAIWQPSTARWWVPLNLLADARSGHEDANTIASTLTLEGGAVIHRGDILLAGYRTQTGEDVLWQVECTWVPGDPTAAPYEFRKLQRADDLAVTGGQI